MKRLSLVLALVALVHGAAHAERKMDGAQIHQGFDLELNLGSQLVSFPTSNGGTNATSSFGVLSGGFFAGYKISRVMVGLGFGISRVATGNSAPGTTDSSAADTAFRFMPGIRVAIVRSPEKRVEMFGEFDLAFGTTTHEQHPSAMGPQPDVSNFLFGYQVGPGVRFWAHPQFAVGGLVGVAGNFLFQSETQAGVTTHASVGVTSLFAQLQLTGVF